MKNKRQELIIEIISHNVIRTQSELIALLKENGVEATQATLSRDIRELKISKAVTDDGIRYEVPEFQPIDAGEKYLRILDDTVISVDYSENILVIKTYSGMAQAAAAAIDIILKDYMLGSIAGDDTIFVVVRIKKECEEITEKIKSYLNRKK
jgi:transcriptional regulator of arginine metabolism